MSRYLGTYSDNLSSGIVHSTSSIISNIQRRLAVTLFVYFVLTLEMVAEVASQRRRRSRCGGLWQRSSQICDNYDEGNLSWSFERSLCHRKNLGSSPWFAQGGKPACLIVALVLTLMFFFSFSAVASELV